MDPSQNSYRNFLSQTSESHPYESSTQNSPPQQFPINLQQSQFPQNFAPQFLQNFNPFAPLSTQPYGRSPPMYQGVQHPGNWRHSTTTNLQGLQHGFSLGASGNSSSHGSESSNRYSARQEEKQAINIEESSDSGEEEGRRAPRVNCSKDENKRFVSAWLHNSVDSVSGNDKKGEAYWKDVARDFNNSMPKNGHKRSVRQLKTHWSGVKRDIAKFCGVYSRVVSGWSSGHSDDMIMDKARLIYKTENGEKPFTVEYMWKDLRDQPKWRRVLAQEENKNKRTKNSEGGAYTSSSNQDTETESVRKEKRPEGQKTAKARVKGKGKNAAPTSGEKPTEDMVLFHQAVTSRAKAQEALAKSKKLEAYIKLEDKDTSNYSEARLKAHEALLEKLAIELAQD